MIIENVKIVVLKSILKNGVRTLQYIFICSLVVFMNGCFAHSRFYQPVGSEQLYFEQSIKSVFPSDLKSNPEKFKGKLIHWVGIIESFSLKEEAGFVIYSIILDQKYYDYVEDFSVQTERMFFSPEGEGKFIYLGSRENISAEELKKELSITAAKDNLAFCYGYFTGLQDDLPVLKGVGVRYISEEYYATNINYYKIKRDVNGNVVVDGKGIPVVSDFKRLKVPGIGKND